jgi:hypothetical protein
MIEIRTDFPYLGARDYIHGTSILSGFLDALDEAGQPATTLKRLKFQRPATSNGKLFLTTDSIEAAELDAANSVFLGTAGETVWRGLFVESGNAVLRRVATEYAISDLRASGFGGNCTIAPADREDLIRLLVEANKRFHEAAVAPARAAMRFGYMEDWSIPPRDIRFSGRLDVANRIARQSGRSHMTINRLSYRTSAAATASTLTLCFNVDALEGEAA